LSARTPKDPEYEARIRASFAKQGFMKTMGAHLTRVLPGAVEIELPLSPAVSQQAGIAHGGALVAIADSATGYAALSLMPPGTDTVTIELTINYLAPAVGDRMVARGRVVKAGRRTTVTQAEVFAEIAGEEKLVGLVMPCPLWANSGHRVITECKHAGAIIVRWGQSPQDPSNLSEECPPLIPEAALSFYSGLCARGYPFQNSNRLPCRSFRGLPR
jgi:uncharacterized protein (TIGR00369 family)